MLNRTVNVFVEAFNMTELDIEGPYVFVAVAILSYLFALCSNSLLIFIIAVHVQLHQPMYLLLFGLSINEIIGMSALVPPLVYNLLSEHRLTSFFACLFQALVLHLYAGTSFLILSAMAFDRYIAICHPLVYHAIMTKTTVKYILLFCSLVNFLLVGFLFVLTLRFPFCSTHILNYFCDNFTILRMTCAKDITINNIYGLVISGFYHGLSLFSIVFSYTFILIVCLRNKDPDARSKALSTCVTHFLVFMVSECTSVIFILVYRIPESPLNVKRVMGIAFVIVPSCFNPIIYGAKTKEIKQRIKQIYDKIFHRIVPGKPRLNAIHELQKANEIVSKEE